MEARDLDAARRLLGKGFAVVFPGTRPRYGFVKKSDNGHVAMSDGANAVVYCRGQIAGVRRESDRIVATRSTFA